MIPYYSSLIIQGLFRQDSAFIFYDFLRLILTVFKDHLPFLVMKVSYYFPLLEEGVT